MSEESSESSKSNEEVAIDENNVKQQPNKEDQSQNEQKEDKDQDDEVEKSPQSKDDTEKKNGNVGNSKNNNSNNNSNNSNNNNGNNNKKKKNKRKRKPREDDILEMQQERYDKLLYNAKKQIHKHAKKCKAFMVQKSIRSLKKQSRAPETCPKLKGWKALDLDAVVDQAIRQLGLRHANPNPDAFSDVVPNNSNNAATSNPLVTTLLQHSQFQSTLEEWNQKVTEFRRWCLSWNERNDKFLEPKVKTKKRKNNDGQSPYQRQHESQQQQMSTFCSLGGDDMMQGEHELSAYGPAAGLDVEPKKKNRKGQRARRAKAMALQAKKEGREYQSINWRSSDEKKQRKQNEENETRDQKHNSSRNSENQNAHVDPVEQHPSWAAKQQQKVNIVAFQGKKITFD